MIQIAICDDNEEDVLETMKQVEEALNFYKYKAHVECFYSGEKLLERVEAGWAPDIALLDIEMNDVDGISVAQQIRSENVNSILIYVSLYDQYCKELISTKPYAFIDKPIDADRMQEVLRNAISEVESVNEKYCFTYRTTYFSVEYKDILFFESEKRMVNVHCNNGKKYSFYKKLDKVYEEVKDAPVDFIRLTKSCIVNASYARIFRYNHLELADGTFLPISKTYKDSVREYYLEKFVKKC